MVELNVTWSQKTLVGRPTFRVSFESMRIADLFLSCVLVNLRRLFVCETDSAVSVEDVVGRTPFFESLFRCVSSRWNTRRELKESSRTKSDTNTSVPLPRFPVFLLLTVCFFYEFWNGSLSDEIYYCSDNRLCPTLSLVFFFSTVYTYTFVFDCSLR